MVIYIYHSYALKVDIPPFVPFLRTNCPLRTLAGNRQGVNSIKWTNGTVSRDKYIGETGQLHWQIGTVTLANGTNTVGKWDRYTSKLGQLH